MGHSSMTIACQGGMGSTCQGGKRQEDLWQKAGRLDEVGFDMKDSEGGVQGGNVHVTANS